MSSYSLRRLFARNQLCKVLIENGTEPLNLNGLFLLIAFLRVKVSCDRIIRQQYAYTA
jgi:hypothetical protein